MTTRIVLLNPGEVSPGAIASGRLASLVRDHWLNDGIQGLFCHELADWVDEILDSSNPGDRIGQLIADAVDLILQAVVFAAFNAADPALRQLDDHDLGPDAMRILDRITTTSLDRFETRGAT